MNTSQPKRKHNYQHNSYSEEAVDDLAFAASYAIVTTPDIPIESPGKEPTQNLKEKCVQIQRENFFYSHS